jgi:hypothetical protein
MSTDYTKSQGSNCKTRRSSSSSSQDRTEGVVAYRGCGHSNRRGSGQLGARMRCKTERGDWGGIKWTCSPTEEKDGDDRILKRDNRWWSSRRPNRRWLGHQGAWMSGALCRGEVGDHEEVLTEVGTVGERPDTCLQRKLGRPALVSTGGSAPVIHRWWEGEEEMCLGKVELLVMADSSVRQRSQWINDEELVVALGLVQLNAAAQN